MLLAGGLLASMLSVRADDAPKKPADDSITANRKELEALRTESALSPAPEKLGISAGLEMPGLSVGAAAPAPGPNPDSKDQSALPVKSSGWLIDGMEKARNGSGRDAGINGRTGVNDVRDRKDLENFRTNPKDRLNPAVDGGDRENAQVNGREDPRELKPGEKVPNPLTGYMASWMTPGDFNLLQKPATGAGGAFAKVLPDFTTPTTAGPGLNAPSGMTEITAGAGNFGSGPAAIPENPYLQALTGQPAPTAGTGTEFASRQMLGPIPTAPAPTPAWLSPQTPEPSRLSPLVPDNLKPSDDAKYFPQLKRF